MERKVGEIFEYNGEWYQCVEGTGCYKCAFYDKNICIANNPHCTCRSDKKNVIFKKLEKVGEPIRIENKSYQKIKAPCALCDHCAFYDNFSRNCKLSYYINHYPAYSCLTNEMFVEIKQNKENMGEKKLNLKPFDLEAAKAGKPVCTRDGRKARIICFDRKYLYDGQAFSIVALVNEGTYSESVYSYTKDGLYEPGKCHNHDLMMHPQKKEGWIIIHKEAIYDKETAEKIVRETTANVIRIQKIEWEE